MLNITTTKTRHISEKSPGRTSMFLIIIVGVIIDLLMVDHDVMTSCRVGREAVTCPPRL